MMMSLRRTLSWSEKKMVSRARLSLCQRTVRSGATGSWSEMTKTATLSSRPNPTPILKSSLLKSPWFTAFSINSSIVILRNINTILAKAKAFEKAKEITFKEKTIKEWESERYADTLTKMMYVSGETAEPSAETTGMVEEIVRQQVIEMVSHSDLTQNHFLASPKTLSTTPYTNTTSSAHAPKTLPAAAQNPSQPTI